MVMDLMSYTAMVYVGGYIKKVWFKHMIYVTGYLLLTDSDDSDTEGGLGNVERVVMRPPGHSGKAKRGHLCFDSCFETGKRGPYSIKKGEQSLIFY